MRGGEKIENLLKERYNVNKDEIQTSYEKQIGLKYNEQYENMTDEACMKILEYFSQLYQVITEVPKGREKSPKSILNKIKNLEIERMSKLYVIEGIDDNEKNELFRLIKERIEEIHGENKEKILDSIKKIIYDKIQDIDINKVLEDIMIESISKSTKTALIRIITSKVIASNLINKKEILEQLDLKYGKKAALISGIPEDDILEYECIINTCSNREKMEALHNVQQYLKVKDLRGMKIIITNIPDEFKTNNRVIKKLMQKRKNAKTDKEVDRINNECSIEIGKEFILKLLDNKELLDEIGIRIIPESIKYKKKNNGYEANHIKFEFNSNPEYTFELQLKSKYVEELSKGEGSAAHENRPGKQRILPDVYDRKKFIQQVEHTVPRYTLFVRENGKFVKRKYNILQNTMSYYQTQINENIDMYEDIVDTLEEYMGENR